MIKAEVIDKFALLITAAFGLVAALAWNSAVQSIFAVYVAGEGIAPKLIYAVFVTILAVLVTLWIGKMASKVNGRKK